MKALLPITSIKSQAFATLAERPSAAVFGNGMAQVTTALFALTSRSDGIGWVNSGASALLVNRPAATTLGVGTWQVGKDI